MNEQSIRNKAPLCLMDFQPVFWNNDKYGLVTSTECIQTLPSFPEYIYTMKKHCKVLMAKLKSGTGDTEAAHIVVYGTMLK
ncbi:hypothetical protein AAUPMB_21287, partial [Pasteurella multocida subsp. multocida str. Anand1_buffalo]